MGLLRHTAGWNPDSKTNEAERPQGGTRHLSRLGDSGQPCQESGIYRSPGPPGRQRDLSTGRPWGHGVQERAAPHITRWIDSQEVTKSTGTTTGHRHIVEAFRPHLGDQKAKSIQNITPQDISSFRDAQIKAGQSPSTANMALKPSRIALNVARRQGLITTTPADAVDLLAAKRGERKTFSREQIKPLLARANDQWRGMIIFGDVSWAAVGRCRTIDLGQHQHGTPVHTLLPQENFPWRQAPTRRMSPASGRPRIPLHHQGHLETACHSSVPCPAQDTVERSDWSERTVPQVDARR